MKKKGQIQQLQSLIIPLVGIGIVLAIGFLILAEVKTQALQTEAGTYGACNVTSGLQNNTGIGCGYAVNGTLATQSAMDDIPGWLPIIVITVIGALLIGLVSMFRARA